MLGSLQPEKIEQRRTGCIQEIEAGSPRPELELRLDPLGLVGPALKPFAGNAAIEEDQPSPRPTGRCVCSSLSLISRALAFDCQALMRKVNAFRSRAQAGWDGGPLEILVTGRSAYVAEISLSMRPRYPRLRFRLHSSRWHSFLCRISPLAAVAGMGISLLLSCLVRSPRGF